MVDATTTGAPWAGSFIRSVALEDIRIRAGGSGRTVEAYAAVFGKEAEIMDGDGHYNEVNHPSSFNRTLAHRAGRGFPVVYHHGMTLAGTPSERGSVPIGVSIEATADRTGVKTVWEAARTPLADEVLEAIRMGSVTAQSYGGRFLRSDPRKPPGGFRAGPDGRLRTVTRMEVAMHEFGPTPFPAFSDALITGMRAQQLLGRLVSANSAERLTLLNELDQLATPLDADSADPSTSDPEPADQTADAPAVPSVRSIPLSSRVRAALIARGLE